MLRALERVRVCDGIRGGVEGLELGLELRR